MATKVFEGTLADAQKLDLAKSMKDSSDALRENLTVMLKDDTVKKWLISAVEKDADFKKEAAMSPDGKNINWGDPKTKAAVAKAGKKFKLKLSWDKAKNEAYIEFCGQKGTTHGLTAPKGAKAKA